MIVRVAIRAGGSVSDGVLIARLFGHTVVKLFHVLALQSVVHVPAGIVGVLGEALKPAVEKCSPYTNAVDGDRSEEHTSELQSRGHLVCRLLLEKKKIVN